MEQNSLGFVEDFGQKVDLTQRIREVLANYPEGTTILKELIQNADDAGATKVCFCLDRRQHGVESLVYGPLAEWQGPALLAYNNAQFGEEDFESISRIGDSKKRSQAWKTGRFGVGFNSVYHLSDLPSFVSGRYVVFFDPHCKYLPRVSAANPGKRINFVSSSALKRHKDQFTPYCVFGCDMENVYPGTVFRFPLRNTQQAVVSRLSRQSYSEEDMSSLLHELYLEAVHALLFLKNVEKIEIYDWQVDANCLSQVYSCQLKTPTPEVSWHRQAFSRLSMTPFTLNNKSCSSVPHQDVFSLEFVSESFSGATSGEKRYDSFLIAQCMGSPASRIGTLAKNAAKDYDLHLVPWASVAANISSHKALEVSNTDGRAFCFLPLPVKTGLPVHVNGYFELSSNRRDIWYGADMDRTGKLRSDWNVCLLEDVVAPAFSQLLLQASIQLGPSLLYYGLWPCGSFSEPWLTMVKRFYAITSELPVLHSATRGGEWVKPLQAFYHDEEFLDAEGLALALLAEGLPLVRLSISLRNMLFGFCVSSPKLVVPSGVRAHLCKLGRHEGLRERTSALVLLEYCLGDVIDEEAADVLVGLPLIPLANGALGTFSRKGGGSQYFVCRELDYCLFKSLPAKVLDIAVPNRLYERLHSIAQLSSTNLCALTDALLADTLGDFLPAEWKYKDDVEWRPETLTSHPEREWVAILWQYLREFCKDLWIFKDWPILPLSGGSLARLTTMSRVLRAGDLSTTLENLLMKLGCKFLHPEMRIDHPQLTHYVHDASMTGVLDAIFSAASHELQGLPSLFEKTTSAEKRELRDFLFNAKWYGGDQVSDAYFRIFKSLPIFEAYTGSGTSEMLFVDLEGPKRFLAPSDMDDYLLGPEFLYTSSEREADVLMRLLGIRRLSRPAFYKWRVLGRVSELSPDIRDRMMLSVLKELPQLCAADPSMREMLKQLAFVPTTSGKLRVPRNLYDPRILELLSLLDDADSFPAGQFSSPEVLDMLHGLGLRTSIVPETVIQSARQIEVLISSDPLKACARGRALLSYLDLNANKWLPQLGDDANKSISRLLTKFSSSFQAQEVNIISDETLNKFWNELMTVCWCPVLVQPPHPHLPWPCAGSPVAPPKLVRMQSDMWVASASMRILDGECRSAALALKLGWASGPGGSVLAAQLLELGRNHIIVGDKILGQALATAVPRIYTLLNRMLGTEDMEIVKAVLEGCRWVWVGDGFASIQEVAFKGPLHLAPYLRVIPADLASFKELLLELGVRETLTPTEFSLVLSNMAKDMGGSPLDSQQLSAAVWLVQHLADLHLNLPPFVPDANSILVSASELVYNDAPWLPNLEAAPVAGQRAVKGPRFVHSKISTDVAERVGVRSLRRLLLAESADSMDLGLHEAAERFGQHEALTTRLKHIVEMYADGPGILCELVQNADDAGASEVSFLLDKTQYGTSSVLSPRMTEWQGAALYCMNNSVFTARDLYAISRIGQDSKLEKPSAIGRFGLGFNSVYHFTDIPGFISGGNLVIFDPHACNLPGITPSHPGLKISFVGRGLLEQFPDQFRPYLLFGSDLQKPFPGTLFRFPLRNHVTALSSEIKQEVYSPQEVLSLFWSFLNSAAEALLFLRNVTSIRVLVREDANQEMQQLYHVQRQGCESKEKHDIAHKQVYEFVRGDPQNPIDKEQFYRKLQRTPVSQLPWHCGKVEISIDTVDIHKRQVWLISNAIGGAHARDQSMASENRSHGFVPWAGVAAPLQADSALWDSIGGVLNDINDNRSVVVRAADFLEGRAFCFLPLPVKTGLPVHVNGYFELSSNRRDIWYGDDMSGGGKLRSNWNRCLLEDVAAPAYARLLSEAAKEFGPTAGFYSLWPTGFLGEPWSSLVQKLYSAVVDLDLPVLHTAAGRGKWVSAKRAVFPDNSFSDAQQLGKYLAEAGLPLVNAPEKLVTKFREICPSLRYLTPHLLRKSLTGSRRIMGNKPLAVLTLKYCLSDVKPDEAEKLIGLSLLPLSNGTIGTISKGGSGERILIVNEEEWDLLHDSVPYMLIDREIEDEVFVKLQLIAKTGLTNLSPLTGTRLEEIFSRLVPADWQGENSVLWTPGLHGHPSLLWIELLWNFLNVSCEDLLLFSEWPLIPTSDGQLLRLTVQKSRVLRDDGWSENMVCILQKAQCYLLRSDISLRHPSLGEYVHDATAVGVLNALFAASGGSFRALPSLLSAASDGELRELRSFVCQSKWFASDSMGITQVEVLRALPIFESYGNHTSGRRRFVDLPEGNRWFPPEGVDKALLGENFIQVESQKEEDVLMKSLGVIKLSKAVFYQEHVFKNIAELNTEVRVHAMLKVLKDLPILMKEDSSLSNRLCRLRFVSTEGGALETPERLYDPRIPELQTLLNKHAFFPSKDYCASDVLDTLVQLGLRRSLGHKGLLDSARSVSMISSSNEAEAVRRAKALLMHLNNLDVSISGDDSTDTHTTSDQLSDFVENSEGTEGKIYVGSRTSIDGSLSRSNQSSSLSKTHIESNHVLHNDLDDNWDSNFWTQLINISWCPVYVASPEFGLPWPQSLQAALASPKLVRPRSQMWLVSASMRILDGDCSSGSLSCNLGWTQPPNTSVLAAQLIELSRSYVLVREESKCYPKESGEQNLDAGFRSILSREICVIYKFLQERIDSPEIVILKSLLEGIPWVWVGDGFVGPKELAFDSPAHFHPYLHIVPSEIADFRSLLTALGVRETFEAIDYANVLHRIAEDVKGGSLSPEQLTFCLRVLEALVDMLPPQGSALNKRLTGWVLMPDSLGILVPAKDLVYNDAPWLAKSVLGLAGMRRLVHPEIENELADRLGAKSLRYLSLVDQEMTSNLPCLAPSAISEVLASFGDESLLLFDLLEIADCSKAQKMHVVYDKREHSRQSLLQPNLGQFQGSSLTFAFEGAVLSTEEVCNLQAYPPTKLRGQFCSYGSGLLSTYNVTDLPFVVSSGFLYLFDPSGQVLSAALADGRDVPSGTPVGKAYSLLGTDLPQRFTDQFQPLRVSQKFSWALADSTIIRLPLRTGHIAAEGNSNSGKAFDDKEIVQIFDHFKTHASTTLLFLNSVEDVCVSVWEEGEPEPHELFSIRVDPARAILRNPFQEKKWRKFQLTNLFGGFNVASKIHSIDVLVTEEGKQTIDKWLVVQSLGSGHTRDMALDRKYLSHNLIPVGGVAAHLTRNGLVASPCNESCVMMPLPLTTTYGLPVALFGHFLVVHQSGHRHLFSGLPTNNMTTNSSGGLSPNLEEMARTWNKELLACICDSYLELLQELQRLQQDPTSSRSDPPIGRGLDGSYGVPAERAYTFWPRSKALLPNVSGSKAGSSFIPGIDGSCLVEWLIKPMYVRLAELPVWKLHGGSMTKAAEGMFLAPPGMDRQGVAPPSTVCEFLKVHYRVFVVPWELTQETESAGVAIKELTPKMLRSLLRTPSVAAAVNSYVTQIDLLEYCCADISFQEPLLSPIETSMKGPTNGLAGMREVPSSNNESPGSSSPFRSRAEQFIQDSRGLPGALDAGDTLGLVADIGRAIVDIGRGVIGDTLQRSTFSSGGQDAKVAELKGLQCPTGTNSMAKLGVVELWVGTKEQQALLPGMATKFVHPSCLERLVLAVLFRHPIYQSMLRLKHFSPQVLAANLGIALPKQWIARGSDRVLSPWVQWEQTPRGVAKVPSSEWLCSFWKNVDTSSSDELNLFTQWPLIPAVTSVSVLVRVGQRDLIFLPPAFQSSESKSDINTNTPGDCESTLSPSAQMSAGDSWAKAFMKVEREHPWLMPLLRNCNVPVYDRNFLDCSVLQSCIPVQGQSLGQIVASKLLALCQANQVILSELSLMPADCDALFSLLASCCTHSTSISGQPSDQVVQSYNQLRFMLDPNDPEWASPILTETPTIPAYSTDQLVLLRSLPIYKTSKGNYVELNQGVHCVVPPSCFFQPDEDNCLQYYSMADGGSFYSVLGVSELTDHEVLARFALPGYERQSEREQDRTLAYIYSNWGSLKQQDLVVNVLKQTKFVRSGVDTLTASHTENQFYCPQDLLDPENPLLKRVFAREAGRFPGGQFATSGWLYILRDLGLRSATDGVLLLECAKKVEELGKNYSSDSHEDFFESESGGSGSALSTEIWSTAGMLVETILGNFASIYGSSFCDPLSRIACVPAERGISSAGTGRGKRVLASYGEAALLKDWSLVWTCAPVLARPGVVPPEFSWGTLRLRSPPPFATVLKHLKTVGKNGGEDILARWPNGRGMKSVEDAFNDVLKYLNSTWDGLSNSDKAALRGVHFIPVANGTRLAAANALYARINIDLAPFVFELPSPYLPYVKVLGELGMQEAPSFESMNRLLLQLQQSCGYQHLNPNELQAILRILQFICDRGNQNPVTSQSNGNDPQKQAVVPDDGGRLVLAKACVYVDAAGANLVGKIDLTRVRFVHPLVSEPLCIQLGVCKLSDVVVEDLDENKSLEVLDSIGETSLSSVAQKLRSAEFAESIWAVVQDSAQSITSLRQLQKDQVETTLLYAADGLWFVRHLYTRFLLLPSRTDITKRSSKAAFGDEIEEPGHRVFEFVDKGTDRVFIAEAPHYVTLMDLLAVLLSRLLGSPTCLPISALLNSPLGMELTVKHALRLGSGYSCDVNFNDGLKYTGVSGMTVTRPDAVLVQCHPLRPFHAGEIVAWRPEGDGRSQLRYGRVVVDVRASAGQPLYRFQVETGPGDIQLLLSSQVFSFKATASLQGQVQTGSEDLHLDNPQVLTQSIPVMVKTPLHSVRQSATPSFSPVQDLANSDNTVSAAEVVRAVTDMLSAAGMPMNLDQKLLLERSLSLQEQLAAADTALSIEQERADTAAKEAEAARASWTCRVCLTVEVDTMVVPCGHVLCHPCSSAVTRCPFCRRSVSKALRIYRP